MKTLEERILENCIKRYNEAMTRLNEDKSLTEAQKDELIDKTDYEWRYIVVNYNIEIVRDRLVPYKA